MLLASQGETCAGLLEEHCAYMPAATSGSSNITKIIKEANKQICGIFTLGMKSILLDEFWCYILFTLF